MKKQKLKSSGSPQEDFCFYLQNVFVFIFLMNGINRRNKYKYSRIEMHNIKTFKE